MQRRALACGLIAAALVLAWIRWDSHEQIDAQERARLTSQVHAMRQNLERQLGGVRAALLDVRDDLQRWPEDEREDRARQQFKVLSRALAGLGAMHWVDAQGRVRAANRPEEEAVGQADQAWFQAARAAADPQVLHVSQPYPTAKGAYALKLSLVLPDPAGSTAGLLTATLDAGYYSALLASVLYADDMRASIMHADGTVLASSPPDDTAPGVNVARPGSPLSRHLQSGRTDSLQYGRSVRSGDDRLLAHQTFQPASLKLDQALVLGVSRQSAAIFDPWIRQTVLLAVIYAAFAVAAWLLLWGAQRRRAEREKLTAETLARSAAEAERLAMVLDGGELAMWDADLASGTGTVNQRWYTMLGYAGSDILPNQQAWEALVHPDDLPAVLQAFQAHVDGRTPAYEAQYRLRHRDGRWVWVLDRGRVFERSSAGVALRMAGTHLDLTARVQAEEALREREAQLARLADALPGPVARIDREGRYRFANAAYAEWFGFDPEAVVGRTRREVFGEQLAALIEPHIQRALAGESLRFDAALPTVNGPREAINSLLPDRDADGVVRGVFIVVTDISERKRAERQLRLLQAAVSGLDDMVVITQSHPLEEPGPPIVFVNDAFERVTGWRRDEVLGRSPRFLTGPETDRAEVARIDRALAEGRSVRSEVVNYTRAGQPYWVDIALAPVLDEIGRVTHIVSVHRDISERRQAEVDRRLLERQLREAQKIESIGTLAGGIAHDFNNILAAILGNVALARGDLPPEHSAQASLEQVHKASLRARSLVQQILTFSRRQLNPLLVQPLRPIIDETLALLRATLPAAVRVDAVMADEVLWVRADATQIQQVLMNLCTNAWHALPDGRGRIEIGCARVPAGASDRPPPSELGEGPSVHLWVHDDGVGMDAATLERIFDPFFTTKPVGQGTGLGLSVVHGIVRGHSGAARVDSAPGQGSTFHLYFPLATPPAPGEPVADSASPQPGPGLGQRVLYVDDDEVMLLMVERLLQRQGYSVTVAGQAAQALELLRADPGRFDIVVSDFNMPETSGLELARQLRRLRPGLPVIISSGYVTEELHGAAAQLGVRALLNKERTLEELPGLLQRVLQGSEPRQP